MCKLFEKKKIKISGNICIYKQNDNTFNMLARSLSTTSSKQNR